MEKKKIEEDKLGVREQTKEDDDKIDNMVNLYYELQKKFLGTRKLKREVGS